MNIPLSSLLIVIIGSVASLASFAASLIYLIVQERRKKGHGSKKVTLAIGNETITVKTTAEEMTKLVDTMKKYQERYGREMHPQIQLSPAVSAKRPRHGSAIRRHSAAREHALSQRAALE